MWLLALGPLLVDDAAARPVPERIQELLALGETPTTMPFVQVERDGSKVRGMIANAVALPTEHLLREVLLCYGSYPAWFPLQTKAAYVRDVVGNTGQIYGAFTFPWPLRERDFEARITGDILESAGEKLYRIAWTHEPGTGNVATMQGRWLVQELDATRSLVIYDATVDFDTWVPSFLMARGTAQFLPAILERMATRSGPCPAEHRPSSLPY